MPWLNEKNNYLFGRLCRVVSLPPTPEETPEYKDNTHYLNLARTRIAFSSHPALIVGGALLPELGHNIIYYKQI